MSENIASPMPRTITKVLVSVGDQVQEDDEVAYPRSDEDGEPDLCAPRSQSN